MTDSAFPQEADLADLSVTATASSTASSPLAQVRWLVGRMAIATLILMAIGSATRVMNAGLACPDWPLCYGTLIPSQQMNFQVFLEWFHRLDASLIGLMAIALVGLSGWHRRHLPSWLPWAAVLALGLVIAQGILGGLTVTEMLRFDIVTAHLGTALLFFTTLLVIGTRLMPYQGTGVVGRLPGLGLSAAILVYLQSLLGGLVASRWSVHQCLGQSQLCVVVNSHILGVLPPTLTILALLWLVWRTPALSAQLRRLANLASLFLMLQILLGISTLWLHLQIELLTVAHQTVGAALLGTLVSFTVLAWRDRQAAQQNNQIPTDQEIRTTLSTSC
ncbi:MAG: heme A synthase [Cyanothece sp. SIO1E1]|nr:heme A synthase [Cyanothece sp. SIO1E1]